MPCRWGPCAQKFHWSMNCDHVEGRDNHLGIAGLTVYVIINNRLWLEKCFARFTKSFTSWIF